MHDLRDPVYFLGTPKGFILSRRHVGACPGGVGLWLTVYRGHRNHHDLRHNSNNRKNITLFRRVRCREKEGRAPLFID